MTYRMATMTVIFGAAVWSDLNASVPVGTLTSTVVAYLVVLPPASPVLAALSPGDKRSIGRATKQNDNLRRHYDPARFPSSFARTTARFISRNGDARFYDVKE